MKTAIKRILLMLLMVMTAAAFVPGLGTAGKAFAAAEWIESAFFSTAVALPEYIVPGESFVQPESGEVHITNAYTADEKELFKDAFTVDVKRSGWYHFYSENGEYVRYGDEYYGETYGGDFRFKSGYNQFRITVKIKEGNDYIFDTTGEYYLMGAGVEVVDVNEDNTEITVALTVFDKPMITDIYLGRKFETPSEGMNVTDAVLVLNNIIGTSEIPQDAISISSQWFYSENGDFVAYKSGEAFRSGKNELRIGIYIEDEGYGLDNKNLIVYLDDEQLKPWVYGGDSMAQKSWYLDIESVPPGPQPETKTSRLFGGTRYDTSLSVADAYKEKLGVDEFESVIIACGTNYADALAGSYLSAVKKAPILIVDSKHDHIVAVQDYIRKNVRSGGMIYLLGGEAVVPYNTVTGLIGYDVKRLGGNDRYETNLKILQEAGVSGDEILVASGIGFADSLSASATGKPILLVKNTIQDSQKDYVASLKGKKFFVIGGSGAVNDDLEAYFKTLGETKRLGGQTRYDTSVSVARQFFPEPKGAVLAYGANFPDGLCGGSLANAMGGPLLLAANGKADQAAAYAKEKGIKGGAILGGPTLINDDNANKVFS